jgi:hypothetical protein
MAAGWPVEKYRVSRNVLNSILQFQPATACEKSIIHETSGKNGILYLDQSKLFMKGYVPWNTER